MKSLPLVLALAIAASGCVAGRSREYRIGELKVRLHMTFQSLYEDLPAQARIDAASMGERYFGFYSAIDKTIWSLAEAEALLHEIKHYLEPKWRHATDCSRATNRCLTPLEIK